MTGSKRDEHRQRPASPPDVFRALPAQRFNDREARGCEPSACIREDVLRAGGMSIAWIRHNEPVVDQRVERSSDRLAVGSDGVRERDESRALVSCELREHR